MTITKHDVDELEQKFLLQECIKTDQVVSKFRIACDDLFKHCDHSNSLELRQLKEKIVELTQDMDWTDQDILTE